MLYFIDIDDANMHNLIVYSLDRNINLNDAICDCICREVHRYFHDGDIQLFHID